ncbi:MAG: ABC transporter ATP-binding protein [Eubacteriaceae bacterium]
MIKLENITKQYAMGQNILKALDDVSLEINDGEYISIMGPSGSGKSTLMNILGCLDIADEGKYYLDDKEINEYTDNQLSEIRNQKIGFVFQKFNLLPKLNAVENVELSLVYRKMDAKSRAKTAEEYLEKVGLRNWGMHKPNELSGGQQQRVAIARALAGNPQIILADEPTGNLDSASGKEIMQILKDLNKEGKTIILITHDLKVAQQADRILYIIDGKISQERAAV